MEIIDDETQFIDDDYDHSNPGLFYTVTRIGKEFEYYEKGCNCENSNCTTETGCDCLKYGDNYQLNDEGNLILKNDKFDNALPIFECNFNCSCFRHVFENRNRHGSGKVSKLFCPNRNVQFGPLKTLEIFDAGKKGLGLKTNETIRRGTFICEYAGEIINLKTAKEREKNQRDDMNYIFICKEYAGDKFYNVTIVDPTFIGNVGRYINHSCQPNSVIVPIRVNDSTPHLCVFAIRDIEKNEEICYDYSGRNRIETTPSNEIDFTNRKLCYCQSPSCKSFLPYELNV